MMFYSAQTGGFYDSEIHGDNIPTDAVEITAEQHAALLAGQSAGQAIVPDVDGFPVLSDPSPPTLTDLRTAALASLPAWEQAERAAGIDHAGQRWLTTPEALQDIRDVLLAGEVPNNQWLNAEAKLVPMTFEDVQGLWKAITKRRAEIATRKAEMEAEVAKMSSKQLSKFQPGFKK